MISRAKVSVFTVVQSPSLLQSARHVTPARSIPRQQFEQSRYARLRQRAIADIFSRKSLLMHLRAHIARVNPVDAPRRIFSRQDMRELFQRRLARSITTPSLVALN